MPTRYFVVLLNRAGRETYCLYHGEIPRNPGDEIVYAWRLDPGTTVPLSEMYRAFQMAREHGWLPASNVTDADYAGLY